MCLPVGLQGIDIQQGQHLLTRFIFFSPFWYVSMVAVEILAKDKCDDSKIVYDDHDNVISN